MIYIDTSAFLDRMLVQNRHHEVEEILQAEASGGRVVASSRLLRLEVRRAQVRIGIEWSQVSAGLRQLELMPLTEAVWQEAFDIDVHVKTLDAIHLATCQLIGARLLTSDDQLRRAATAIGVAVVD